MGKSELNFMEIREEEHPSADMVIRYALATLRKIRGFSDGNLHIGDEDYTPVQRQQFLLDAEQIGLASAGLLIGSPNEGSGKEGEDALIVNALSTKYSHFYGVESRGSYEEAVYRVASALSLLRFGKTSKLIDRKTLLQRFFLDKNETGLSVENLRDNGLVIFSPLSTDYLIACLIKRFVEDYLTPSCFRLKPFILNRFLESVEMPDCLRDAEWLASVTNVGVFVENNISHDTMRVAWRAVQEFFPLNK